MISKQRDFVYMPSLIWVPFGRRKVADIRFSAADTLHTAGVERLEDGSLRTPAGAQLTPAMVAVFEFGAVSAHPILPVASRDEIRGGPENEPGVLAGAIRERRSPT